MEETRQNPLAVEPVGKLLRNFAIPSIVAMLVSALYNMVDQLFIGHYVGELGNAATNITFPLSISCTAIALLFGIGGASNFNLAMGKKKLEEAVHYVGNAIMMMLLCGLTLLVITELFLEPMLVFFGSPQDVLGYAKTYTSITAIGFPCLIIATGGGHLIRADGSPRFAMFCNLTGAVINTILDALFVAVFHWGMAGAAIATVIGQFVSAMMAVIYFSRYKTVTIQREHLRIRKQYVAKVLALGAAPCSNQLSMMVVQIVLNKSMTYYGAMSVYGEAIPLACSGIISKVGMVFFSFIIGISQGLQPIVSFNYGAKQYVRVKKAYQLAITVGAGLCLGAFLVFQIFPRQIIGMFGEGSDLYYTFAVQYFRIYMFMVFLNFLQPITSNFFTAIGKPQRGVFLSLTRQIIFLLPLIVIFPMIGGIDGMMYAAPVADVLAFIVTAILILLEMRQDKYREEPS